ncbi:MAG: DUF6252 family protein [Cellulophaga sp.]
MKKYITILLLLVLTLSCSDVKKNKTSGGNKIEHAQNESFLTAKIDGVKFYTNVPMYFSAQNIITLAAISKDKNEKIRIYINYNKGPAAYIFGKDIPNSDNMIYTNNKVHWLAAKTKGEGTVTLTEEGGYLIGEFSFTGVNKENNSSKKITNGKFKVRIDS